MIKLDGTKYYAYLIAYVDDVLCIQEDPKQTMDRIEQTFHLKDVISSPKMYLGTDVKEWQYQGNDGKTGPCWALGSQTYVKEAIRIAESHMKKHQIEFTSSKKMGRNTPFSNHQYRPELDTSNLCNNELINMFQNLIGILRWTCELGRLDILHEVSILSQYLAQPRIGHLQQAFNIFYYLKYHD